MTQAEYEVLKKQKYQDYKAGKITNYAYIQWKKKNDPSLNGGAAADPQMKPEEFMQLNNQLSKKLSDGEIDVIEYMKLTNKLSNLYYKDKSSLSNAKKELGLDGPLPKDPGLAATTQADEETLKKLTKVYRKAQKEIKAKLKEWQDKYKNDAFELWKKQHNGEITQSEYKTAMEHLAFHGELWNKKLDQVTGVLANANEEALQIINDEKMGVFAENANWQSYQITQDTGMDLSFAIYDQDAVGNLIKNEPQLLPKKKLDTAKDKAWNQRKIAGAVAQGIIQGESIPQLAARIAADTASINGDAMIRYARTAMTGAQNAGRLHTLQRAEGMGIKCKKGWLATLDGRTRDSHREMDGVKVGINEKFHTPLGSEMLYPGDVAGKPGDIWCCRCTMVYEYYGYEGENVERIAYEEGLDDNGKPYRRAKLIKDMTYKEWANWRQNTGNADFVDGSKETFSIPQRIRSSVTEESASEDWFEYEKANLMREYIQTGIMPKKDMYHQELEPDERYRLAAEAELMQNTGAKTKTKYKTLYRGMVMDENAVKEMFKPGEIYTFESLSAASPDRKIASIYMDVDNAGGEGAPVIIEIQKPDGIYGFKRDDLETVIPKGSEFRIERQWKDDNGVVHISLYAKKGVNNVHYQSSSDESSSLQQRVDRAVQSEQEESRYSFRNMPRSMGTDEYDQWVKSHSTRAIAKENEQLLTDLWMAESNPGGIHYVQSADGSSAINGYWRNDGAITYAGKWDRTVRPGDKVPSKLQAIYEKDSKSIRETSEAMDRLIQFSRSDKEMSLERWSGADALKRLGIDIGSGKPQRFGHARITDGLNHQDIVDQINQTLKGAVISDKGYSSASVSSERNVFIGSDIKFAIIAPEGTPMYITENTAESEVILARKTEMEVIGARVIDTKARRDEWNGETTEKETKTVEILVKLLQ